jgi:hypothetical protein
VGLRRLQQLLDRALADTAGLWPPIEQAYAWVHQAARILNNETGLTGQAVQRRLSGLLGAMARWRSQTDELALAVAHFLKVTRSYWPGLFHGYGVDGLPRTNNGLEQLFGSQRYHERRATGRKGASPTLVVRGSARLMAAVATRTKRFTAADLAGCCPVAWKAMRAALAERAQTRVRQRHFRQDPQAYLADLENRLFKLVLPP